jgi:hypothetical protein
MLTTTRHQQWELVCGELRRKPDMTWEHNHWRGVADLREALPARWL